MDGLLKWPVVCMRKEKKKQQSDARQRCSSRVESRATVGRPVETGRFSQLLLLLLACSTSQKKAMTHIPVSASTRQSTTNEHVDGPDDRHFYQTRRAFTRPKDKNKYSHMLHMSMSASCCSSTSLSHSSRHLGGSQR